LINENFATMADVHRILGTLPLGVDLMPTADGREKTIKASQARLARMLGSDATNAHDETWTLLARWFAEAQIRAIANAATLVMSSGPLTSASPIIAAGIGLADIAEIARRLWAAPSPRSTSCSTSRPRCASQCAIARPRPLSPRCLREPVQGYIRKMDAAADDVHRRTGLARSEPCRWFQHSRLAVSNTPSTLHLRHRHVLRAHHHHNSASDFARHKRIYRVRRSSTATGADDIILKGNLVGGEICRGALLERIVGAQHWHGYLVTPFGIGKTDSCCLIDRPSLQMR
jgi:hypothetical protein